MQFFTVIDLNGNIMGQVHGIGMEDAIKNAEIYYPGYASLTFG